MEGSPNQTTEQNEKWFYPYFGGQIREAISLVRSIRQQRRENRERKLQAQYFGKIAEELFLDMEQFRGPSLQNRLHRAKMLQSRVYRDMDRYRSEAEALLGTLNEIPPEALISFTVYGPDRNSRSASSFTTLAEYHSPELVEDDDEADTTVYVFRSGSLEFEIDYYPQDNGFASLAISAPINKPGYGGRSKVVTIARQIGVSEYGNDLSNVEIDFFLPKAD